MSELTHDKDFTEELKNELRGKAAPAAPVTPANPAPNPVPEKKVEENAQNPVQPLDNPQNISYISNIEPTPDNLKVVGYLENTYKIPKEKITEELFKVGKSALNAQSYADKNKNEADKLKATLAKSPTLNQLFAQAEQNVDVENLLKGKLEPQGKPVAPVGKPENTMTVDEKTLIEAGLLSVDAKAQLEPLDYKMALLDAKTEYITRVLPEKIAAQTYQTIETKKVEAGIQEEVAKLEAENDRRYKSSFQKAATELGFNPYGEHQEFVEDIQLRVAAALDYKNPKLIREDAVYRAVKEVFEEKGVTPKPLSVPAFTAKQELQPTNGIPVRTTPEPAKLTSTDKLDAKINRTIESESNFNSQFFKRK